VTDYLIDMRTYPILDARTLDLHRRVAEKVRADPQLFDQAAETLKRWRNVSAPHSQPYLAEWARLMALGIEECLRVATGETEYATALRKSSPFSVLLTAEEQRDFLLEWAKIVDGP
jgi:hypothetical protein